MAKVVVTAKGSKYYVNDFDKFHREDGPAFIRPDGEKTWYINSRPQQINYADGRRTYYHENGSGEHISPNGLAQTSRYGEIVWPKL